MTAAAAVEPTELEELMEAQAEAAHEREVGDATRPTAEDLAAGNRRGHQESPGFNTVRQHTVDAAAQALHAFDGNAIATLACDFCAQRVQEVGGIDNLRLASGVFNNRRSLRKRRCAHDGYGGADAHLIHHNMRAFQATADRGFDITFFQFDLGAQLPSPEWGAMLGDALELIYVAPWTVMLPGAAIMLSVLLVNLLGDGIRRAIIAGVE